MPCTQMDFPDPNHQIDQPLGHHFQLTLNDSLFDRPCVTGFARRVQDPAPLGEHLQHPAVCGPRAGR